MGDVTSEVTITTGEWIYVDRFGIGHDATGGFSLNISDDGASDVQYSIAVDTGPLVTSDGYKIVFQPRVSHNNVANQIETLIDTPIPTNGFIYPGINGEIDCKCPVSGVVQHWRVASIKPSDTDFGSAGTIAATFEDQFGNTMSWVAGMSVDQAA